MDTPDYEAKMQSILDGHNTYEQLKKDPTAKYKGKPISIICWWQKTKSNPQQLKDKIYPTSEEIPKIYGTPKIHKANSPSAQSSQV